MYEIEPMRIYKIMNYEISNVVSNHKYSEWEIKHKRPFNKKELYYLIKDTPANLFKVYSAGHSLKPHAFKDPKNSDVNCIVLDFDNLTKTQYDFVKAIVNWKYQFAEMYGDDSAGMKTKRYEHENSNIPLPFNPTIWKFKVFYPTQEGTICTYNDIYKSFLEAVSFFNPFFSMEKVKEIWDLWLKANNNKKKVSNPVFNDWILPDVSYLNSFRTQITYGVNPSQNEKFKVVDAQYLAGRNIFKFNGTTKDDYSGLDWKMENFINEHEHYSNLTNENKNKLSTRFMSSVEKVRNEGLEAYLNYPYNKPMFAKKLKVYSFDDLLVEDSTINSIIWGHIKSKRVLGNPDNALVGIEDIVKAHIFNTIEFCTLKETRIDVDLFLNDIVTIIMTRNGTNIFNVIPKFKKDKLIETVMKAFYNGVKNHNERRLRFKLLRMDAEWIETVRIHLKKYHELKNQGLKEEANDEMGLYISGLNKVMKEHLNEIEETKYPYAYIKKGTKKHLIEEALISRKQFNNEEEWIDWAIRKIDVEDGEIDEDKLKMWFRFWRSEYNKQNNKTVRKSRCSKYDFTGMNKEEIENTIKNLSVSKQMKSNLRRKWLK